MPDSLYYDEILLRVVSEFDGRTPYWPGSPYGGSDHNDRSQGNVHNWEVCHGNFPRRFDSRKRRGSGRASSPVWELKRIVGRLLKLLRSLRNAG